MAPLADSQTRVKLQKALELEVGGCCGYVVWKPIAQEWVDENLEGATVREIEHCMLEHMKRGEKVHAAPATAGYEDWGDHYNFRLVASGRRIYIKVVFLEATSTDPTIRIVSIHDA